MFIRNSIDRRMIDPMELASILPVAGSVIGTADDKGPAPLFFPMVKQPPQLPVRIAQSRFVAVQVIMGVPFQIEGIGIMDGIHIEVHENPLIRIRHAQLSQNKVYLIFCAVPDAAAEGRVPVAFPEISGKYLSQV